MKPSNLLVMREGHVVISDFDISTDRTTSDRTTTGRGLAGQGTQGYMAPEVLARGTHSKAGDMFSFGVALAELALGRLPTGRELGSLQRQGAEGGELDPALRKLLRSLLSAAPERRMDAEAAGSMGCCVCVCAKHGVGTMGVGEGMGVPSSPGGVAVAVRA